MTVRRSITPAIFALGATTFIAANAPGAVIETGFYELRNHPLANGHGLSLVDLVDLTPEADVFTFDFDAEDSSMFLEYDGNAVRIFGRAVGGVFTETGIAPDSRALFDIQFTYGGIDIAGNDDLIVTTPNFGNSGFVQAVSTGEMFSISDYTTNGYQFQFGDRQGEGIGGFDGLSGWGGLSLEGDYSAASRWLFTATSASAPTPAPGGLALLSLAGCIRRRRRRS